MKTIVVLKLKDSEILTDLRLEYSDYFAIAKEDKTQPIQEFGDWAEGYVRRVFLGPWSEGRTEKRKEQLEKQQGEKVKKAAKDSLTREQVLEILGEMDAEEADDKGPDEDEAATTA